MQQEEQLSNKFLNCFRNTSYINLHYDDLFLHLNNMYNFETIADQCLQFIRLPLKRLYNLLSHFPQTWHREPHFFGDKLSNCCKKTKVNVIELGAFYMLSKFHRNYCRHHVGSSVFAGFVTPCGG